jgi:hypothetical protein
VVNEDPKEQWIVLLKFGQRDHLEQLREGGVVYMNPQTYFAKLEADSRDARLRLIWERLGNVPP